ncbi:outer membrane beta-barrel protein [Rudanella lutea]|uniref:outer membrane beta-barrel protein n=1 Tax=Rudanella lutea TaxID=451374 RepID=UPI0003766CF9|nr:outer membrane beta-barrel protein [Rudanella lutea]
MKPFLLFCAAALTSLTTATAQTAHTSPSEAPYKPRIIKDFGFYIGINGVSGAGADAFQLRPLGSRFVALSWRRQLPLSNRPDGPRIGVGPEIAWNNFMFERDQRLVSTVNPATGRQESVLVGDNRDLKRTKLTTFQGNIPVLLMFGPSDRVTFGVGAYAGIRLDSYTKVKPDGGETTRNHGGYNTTSLRWGLTAEAAWGEDTGLFVRYEPSTMLFRDGQGPKVNVWSVGIRL